MSGQGRLDEILGMLHIDVIGKKIEYVHNMIREKWVVDNYKPKDYEECHRYLSRYYQYHFSRYAGASVKMPEGMAYAEVKGILEKSQGGFVLNIKNAIRGRHGGMIALIDLIAEEFKKQATEKYVEYVIGTYVNPLDYGLKVELMRQYLDRYGRHILPGEDLLSPHELAANFSQVIKYHVQLVNQYRNVFQ